MLILKSKRKNNRSKEKINKKIKKIVAHLRYYIL